uniref:MAM domain-containing protein n=1 Tax=Macrostomum lignano TaxID=282301 RepID=A0A1I8IJ62_9PLAT
RHGAGPRQAPASLRSFLRPPTVAEFHCYPPLRSGTERTVAVVTPSAGANRGQQDNLASACGFCSKPDSLYFDSAIADLTAGGHWKLLLPIQHTTGLEITASLFTAASDLDADCPFRCDNHANCIGWDRVCDERSDCDSGADEEVSFCSEIRQQKTDSAPSRQPRTVWWVLGISIAIVILLALVLIQTALLVVRHKNCASAELADNPAPPPVVLSQQRLFEQQQLRRLRQLAGAVPPPPFRQPPPFAGGAPEDSGGEFDMPCLPAHAAHVSPAQAGVAQQRPRLEDSGFSGDDLGRCRMAPLGLSQFRSSACVPRLPNRSHCLDGGSPWPAGRPCVTVVGSRRCRTSDCAVRISSSSPSATPGGCSGSDSCRGFLRCCRGCSCCAPPASPCWPNSSRRSRRLSREVGRAVEASAPVAAAAAAAATAAAEARSLVERDGAMPLLRGSGFESALACGSRSKIDPTTRADPPRHSCRVFGLSCAAPAAEEAANEPHRRVAWIPIAAVADALGTACALMRPAGGSAKCLALVAFVGRGHSQIKAVRLDHSLKVGHEAERSFFSAESLDLKVELLRVELSSVNPGSLDGVGGAGAPAQDEFANVGAEALLAEQIIRHRQHVNPGSADRMQFGRQAGRGGRCTMWTNSYEQRRQPRRRPAPENKMPQSTKPAAAAAGGAAVDVVNAVAAAEAVTPAGTADRRHSQRRQRQRQRQLLQTASALLHRRLHKEAGRVQLVSERHRRLLLLLLLLLLNIGRAHWRVWQAARLGCVARLDSCLLSLLLLLLLLLLKYRHWQRQTSTASPDAASHCSLLLAAEAGRTEAAAAACDDAAAAAADDEALAAGLGAGALLAPEPTAQPQLEPQLSDGSEYLLTSFILDGNGNVQNRRLAAGRSPINTADSDRWRAVLPLERPCLATLLGDAWVASATKSRMRGTMSSTATRFSGPRGSTKSAYFFVGRQKPSKAGFTNSVW